MISDLSSVFLLSVNLIEMVVLFFILIPYFDIVLLSKDIELIKDNLKTNVITLSCVILFGFTIITFGIIYPAKTLNELKTVKLSKTFETTEDKVNRIIIATNASRNYILGAFSLFFLLVLLRLFDFVTFSAKLYEFSNLMANYDVIDVTYKETCEEPEIEDKYVLDEYIDEYNKTVRWPSIAELNKIEHKRIKDFFKVTPTKEKLNENIIPKDAKIQTIKQSDNLETKETNNTKETSLAQTILKEKNTESSDPTEKVKSTTVSIKDD